MDWQAMGQYLVTFLVGGVCGVLALALVVGSSRLVPTDPELAGAVEAAHSQGYVHGLQDGTRDRDERWDIEQRAWAEDVQRLEGDVGRLRSLLRLSELARKGQPLTMRLRERGKGSDGAA